jgi:hypothetical protein
MDDLTQVRRMLDLLPWGVVLVGPADNVAAAPFTVDDLRGLALGQANLSKMSLNDGGSTKP